MSNPKSLVTTAVFKNLHTTGNFINKISTFIHVPCKQLHMTLMILYITSKSNNFLGGWYKWKILKTPTNKWWLKNMKLNSHLIGYCQSLFLCHMKSYVFSVTKREIMCSHECDSLLKPHPSREYPFLQLSCSLHFKYYFFNLSSINLIKRFPTKILQIGILFSPSPVSLTKPTVHISKASYLISLVQNH